MDNRLINDLWVLNVKSRMWKKVQDIVPNNTKENSFRLTTLKYLMNRVTEECLDTLHTSNTCTCD